MTSSATLAAARARHFTLEALPDRITVPPLGRTGDATVLAIADATLDDVAFALRGLEAEFNAVGDRLHALRKLYGLARDAGARGTDRALNTISATTRGR